VTTTAQGPQRSEPKPINPKPKSNLPFFVGVFRSEVGRKWVMAITGALWLLFVMAHMIGNLHVYEGAPEFNHYAEFLREVLVPILPRTVFLWLLRIGLIVSLVLHFYAAIALALNNRKMRGGGYRGGRHYIAANYAARTMVWGGIIVALFIIFHLADLTWGAEAVNPDFERGAVYSNLVASLERVPVAIIYIIANIVLAFHIYHGAWSLFQSLGINNPRFNLWRRWLAVFWALAVAVGNIGIVISVQTGIIG
jgi:succinate dehydrogenase / fumarate reductase cytochrome b subunit